MSARYLAVIPAYNEAATVEQVVRLCQQFVDVCVVDDASTDATPEILARLDGVHTIRHVKNTHIARATLDGMAYAVAAGYDYSFTLDCGMSHDPRAIPTFQARRDADLVIGYRRWKDNVPLHRRGLSWGANVLFNLALRRSVLIGGRPPLRDVTSGYRMYSRRAVQLLLDTPMMSRSFDFHLEALAVVYRQELRIAEVPIKYVFSNSSLRWPIVLEAAHTCRRVGLGGGMRPWATA